MLYQPKLNKRPILITLILTLVAFTETLFFPWSPFILTYATLTVLVPILAKKHSFGNLTKVFSQHWQIFLVITVTLIAWDPIITTFGYEAILKRFNLQTNPFYSITVAVPVLITTSTSNLNIPTQSGELLYAFLALIWAPIGEELFYRGYLQGNLRERMSFKKTVSITTFLFAIRHGFHLLFLAPNIPWVSCLMWIVIAAGGGVLLGYLYEKTKSLYLPILAHFLVNLTGIIFTL